jgi:hypothetical protein
MKRSITRWTTMLATVGVLGLPVTGFARTTQEPQQQQPAQPAQPPAQPQPAQPQPQPAQPPSAATPQQPTTSAMPQAKSDPAVSPQEHLRQAQAAFNSINAASLPKGNRAGLADMKKHLAALETAGSPAGSAQTAPGAAARSKTNWGTEVAAIDKIITEMIGSARAPATSGTTGTPSPTATSGTSSKAAIAIDEATRAKLMEVRTHITAYAAAMSGTATTPTTPKTDDQATMTSTVNAQPAASATAAPSPASTAPTPAATPAATPAQPAAAPAQSPAAPAPNVAASATAAPSPVDAEAARRHLTAAQATLSQLTKLPATAQLTGESRAQVTQLVSNFNELGTAQSNWRASYLKVAANLTALLGPENSDNEVTAAVPTTATGTTVTPGTVGTAATATVEIDPAIRAKLVELRLNLVEFQKASGGLEK